MKINIYIHITGSCSGNGKCRGNGCGMKYSPLCGGAMLLGGGALLADAENAEIAGYNREILHKLFVLPVIVCYFC